ncbi:DUF1499 domain-containing protein [Halomonas urumqiensis]|uniref:DUF1499 domain-containing protein n=1 Tax=Halomonas urumqiensis TaxID=1684789 RepID=A0A2N7UMR9_9GAMM|nr:DUF1499 domain-containing protein [Halomonas urumqiensis]PMR81702.1 DUF1499 domain-containing protein [Halomonas urumqiensis]PTB02339.1 DUF1499 domain-containing protein [Halomonas urumqiensis]GHE21815.1 hypothetical protein GCM10017767_23360 [Halomonas urumqiensis]
MSKFSLRPRPRGGRWPVVFAWVAVLLLVIGAALMGGAGPLHRLGVTSLGESFGLLRQGAYLAMGAAALGLVALGIASVCRRGKPALVGLMVIAAVAGMMVVPWQMMQRAQNVPPIHDITTDMQDPPVFETLAPAREAAPNAVDYPGEDFARQQRTAYPSIQPLTIALPLAEVRQTVEEVAREAGWEIAHVSDSRLEATATTRWFGFKDDVVVRLTPGNDGVRVDVRSASRMGMSDIGTNAGRVNGYLEALKAKHPNRLAE